MSMQVGVRAVANTHFELLDQCCNVTDHLLDRVDVIVGLEDTFDRASFGPCINGSLQKLERAVDPVTTANDIFGC